MPLERTAIRLLTEKMIAPSPLVSILVPIYNVAEYLRECLDSICAQSFTDFEAICINDGSTDNSRQIIAEYLEKDPRFKVIDKPNSGYGASMNQGLDTATGTYLAILESDDFYDPEALATYVQTVQNFDAEVVKSNYYEYFAGPPRRDRFFNLLPRRQTNRLVNPQVEHQIFNCLPAIWAGLYRLDFLRDNAIRFTETPGASYQDTAFNFKVWANAKRVAFLRAALIHYRQDNASSSVRSVEKVYCICDEYAEIDRYLDERQLPSWLHAVKTKIKLDSYLWNYERLPIDYQLEFLKRTAQEMEKEIDAGHLDWQLLDEWKRRDLESLLCSPEQYYQDNLSFASSSRLDKTRRYLKSGGPLLLAKIALKQLLKR